MNGLFPYLLKTVLAAALLYGYYWLALRNRVFHQWNRFYLLLIVPLSLVLPLARIEFSAPTQAAPDLPVRLLQVVSDGNAYVEAAVPPAQGLNPMQLLFGIYTVMGLLLLLHFSRGLWNLRRLAGRYPAQRVEGVDFILAPVPGTPFSFFRRVFWNPAIDPASESGRQILQHELVHVRERHSLDKLFLQLTLVLCWFNPVFWLLRNELHLVHEFIADERSVQDRDAGSLAALILQAAYPQQYSRLTNPFFHRAIKRRLYMLNQLQKARVQYAGRVAALPLLGILAFTFAVRAQAGSPDVSAPSDRPEKFTVVIDAGHGRMANGGWNGASSQGIAEDELTLALAQRIQALNADPNLNIVLTRPDEAIVALKERGEIVRRAGASLFLSLHVSALEKDNVVPANAPEGFHIFVPADSGVRAGSRLFGSVLQQSLSKVYPTDRELHTRKSGIWMLKESPCPGALVEFGYINKDDDRAFLSKEANQERIARELLNAIARYRLRPAAQGAKAVRPAADILPVQKPADVRGPAATVAPADVIQAIDINADRSVTVVYTNGRQDSMSSADAVARGYLNNTDGIIAKAATAQNPPRSMNITEQPVVTGLKSGDTLTVEQFRMLPLQAILSPEGYTLESCTLSANLKSGDIRDANMSNGQITQTMKAIQAEAWSGQMVTVDARRIRTKNGEIKKVPALVFFIR